MVVVDEITPNDLKVRVNTANPNEEYDYEAKITQRDGGRMHIVYRGEPYSILRSFYVNVDDADTPVATVVTILQPAGPGIHDPDEIADERNDKFELSEQVAEYAAQKEWDQLKAQIRSECAEWYVNHPYEDAGWRFPNGRPD